LESGYLRLREAVVKRITVIKFGVNYGGGNDTGSCGIEVREDTAKLTNMIIRFRQRWNKVRKDWGVHQGWIKGCKYPSCLHVYEVTCKAVRKEQHLKLSIWFGISKESLKIVQELTTVHGTW